MVINQQTAAIKARMDRIPAALSPELVERIAADRASGVVNPYRCGDDQVIRRVDRTADEGTLMRPAFMRDTEKILHLPAYTRYAGKTQVFSFRSNDDLSRRGLHVQLVSRIARDIGRALGLNCDLIEAIGLGHDLGHTPFGHAGERFLNDIYHDRTGRYFFITCSRSVCSTLCTAATFRFRRSMAYCATTASMSNACLSSRT
jgi:dGTP_triPase: putative dGTPase